MFSEGTTTSESQQEGGSIEDSPSPSSDRNSSAEIGTAPEKSSSSSSTFDPKICGVCGDKALGNNFNAITCESCKAFFRRNALRTKEFVCPFSNNCKVDAITRRFCQRCRLKKCFDIGMKKEWIMTEDEKRLKKQKIEQNRLKRSSLENSTRRDDNDIPAAKVQRSALAEGSPGVDDDDEVIHDDNVGNPKLHKQPMGLHNNNEQLVQSKKVKESRPYVIPNSESSQETPVEQVFSAEVGHVELPLQLPQSAVHQANYNETLPVTTTGVIPTQQSWVNDTEADSSSSNSSALSLNHSPPLLKFPPVKRQKFFGKKDPEVDDEPVNQTPLLSSLIRPAFSESSPDQSNSPPATQMIPPILDGDGETNPTITRGDDGLNTFSQINAVTTQVPVLILPQNSPPIPQNYLDNSHNHSNHHHHHHHHHHQQQVHPNNHHVLSAYGTHDNPRHYEIEIESHPIQMSEIKQNYVTSRLSQQEQSGHDMLSLPLNTMDSILSVAIAAEFNAFGMLGSNGSKELNKAEQAKLSELFLASQALHAPVDAERPIKVSETSDPSLLNVINLTEIAIRRLIKMSKKISGFKNMCQEDQIALLKGGCTEMMILRSVVTYDPLKDSWEIPHSNPGQYNIHLGVLKEARGNLYEEHQRFVKSFRSEWRKDENIMIILCAITLFTPERLNVVHKDVVKLEQDSYYYLLKRYLESILNGCEAKSTYLQLIRKIAELRALNSSHVRVFLEMNPKEVEPLLIEIFDLK